MNRDYTWGDIIVATCRKMFLNKDAISVSDLADLVDDRNYSTYINSAPDVMNELITILNNRVLVNIDRLFVDVTDSVLLDTYVFKHDETYNYNYEIRIKEYLEDSDQDNYLYTEVVQHANKRADNLLFEEQDGVIYIDRRFLDENYPVLQIKYRIIPTRFTNDTEYDTVINLPYNICAIIPLYLASELYKDDDSALATSYRNQFENELDYISSQMVDSLGTEHSRRVGW